MSVALEKLLASLREAMAADGFVVYCDHFAEGERFRIVVQDRTMRLELLYCDIDVSVPFSEATLRLKLLGMGLTADAIDAKISMGRHWAETISPRLGPTIRFSN